MEGGGFTKYMNDMYNKPELSDVTILLDNEEDNFGQTKKFYGHRVILATMSDYFRVMFFGSFVEADKREIQLKGVPFSVFEKLMRFVYFGWSDRITIYNLEEAVQFYSLARMLLLDSKLNPSFGNWMGRNIQNWEKDLCQLLALGFEWDIPSLKDCCNSHFCEYANEFLAYDSFVELPLKAVQMILKNASMNCTRAELGDAVKAWIKHHKGGLKKSVLEKLTMKVSSHGKVCYDFCKLSLYPKKNKAKLKKSQSVPECFGPFESMIYALHEYSYTSELRVQECFSLRGVIICLRANQQFGPQHGRLKSELKLSVEARSTNTRAYNDCITRNLTVRYDFTQQDRSSVTIFFPAVDCCKSYDVQFCFKWSGSGVQPLLENYGRFCNDTVAADSSYVTHIFTEWKEERDCEGCSVCESDYDSSNYINDWSTQTRNSEEEMFYF